MTRWALLRLIGSMRPLEAPTRRLLHESRLEASPDRVIVNRQSLRANLRGDGWHKEAFSLQPLTLTLTAHADTTPAGTTDNLELGFSYVDLAKRAQSVIEEPSRTWKSLYEAAEAIAQATLLETERAAFPPSAVTVELDQPKGALSADSLSLSLSRARNPSATMTLPRDTYSVKTLRLDTIIGVREHERQESQRILVNVQAISNGIEIDLHLLTEIVEKHIRAIQPELIETMCHSTCLALFAHFADIDELDVRIGKPSASQLADSMDVAVHRKRTSLRSHRLRDALRKTGEHEHVAIVAIGSNMGDRADHLWQSVATLRDDPSIEILDTSFLYESQPMYVRDQAPFLNGVVALSTSASAEELLDKCKAIEQQLGRVKVVEKGPRNIDLDVLLFDDTVIHVDTQHGHFAVPHRGIYEREFVLRPLLDLIPAYRHPTLLKSISQLLAEVMASQDDQSQLRRVMPLRASENLIDLDGPTKLMSIINTTPDSFSDGGDTFSLPDALASARSHIELGADLLDIGGASTRPGATDPGTDEEVTRVVPVISAIREEHPNVPLSVDTYRAQVAEAAVRAGANLINDVSCGAYIESAGLLETAARLRCPIVLMHSRGTPETMSRLTDYSAEGSVIGARKELAARVEAALTLGIPRWAIMIDPGIGFAKGLEGNLEILRDLDKFPQEELQGFPLLLGASRKRFLGTLTGREPKERVWATSATVAAAVQAGAQIVRVHDTKEMKDVVTVANAIWKGTV